MAVERGSERPWFAFAVNHDHDHDHDHDMRVTLSTWAREARYMTGLHEQRGHDPSEQASGLV